MADGQTVHTPETPSWRARLKSWLRKHFVAVTLTLLITAFVLINFSDRIFISLYPGQAGLIWFRFLGGTSHRIVLGEGIHVVFPWDIVYRYDMRVQERTDRFLCHTSNGLDVWVEQSIRFAPVRDRIPGLHVLYGPDYVRKAVLPESHAALQQIVGQYTPEELYATRRSDLEVLVSERARSELPVFYIQLVSLNVLKIELPEKVQKAIQAKLEEQQMVLLYDYRIERERKEATRKEIEAEGIVRFQAKAGAVLTDKYLTLRSIDATLELAKSPNTKVIVTGSRLSPVVLTDGK